MSTCRNPYFSFKSAYETEYQENSEPLFTNYTTKFIGTLDYIWYTKQRYISSTLLADTFLAFLCFTTIHCLLLLNWLTRFVCPLFATPRITCHYWAPSSSSKKKRTDLPLFLTINLILRIPMLTSKNSFNKWYDSLLCLAILFGCF